MKNPTRNPVASSGRSCTPTFVEAKKRMALSLAQKDVLIPKIADEVLAKLRAMK